MSTPAGVRLPVTVGEKGTYWCTIRVRGTPGHASMPLRTDNALVKAAEVVTRLSRARPEARIDDGWRRFVQGLDLPPDDERDLLDPHRLEGYCRRIEDVGWARTVHASTHMTVAPTIAHGGVQTNLIPHTVELPADGRTLPGGAGPAARATLAHAPA